MEERQRSRRPSDLRAKQQELASPRHPATNYGFLIGQAHKKDSSHDCSFVPLSALQVYGLHAFPSPSNHADMYMNPDAAVLGEINLESANFFKPQLVEQPSSGPLGYCV
ncbi:hypothetical protein KCU78_g20148, partial [Aureobasidium melanogenum]